MAQIFPVTLILALILLGVSASNARAETYYVKPTANSSCPEDGLSCLTLNEYATFLRNSSAENITLIVLAGNHSLNTDLTVVNVTRFTMFSDFDTDIVCDVSANFQFRYIGEVEISGLKFRGCRVSFVHILDQFTLNRCEIRGIDSTETVTGVELSFVKFVNINESIFAWNNKTFESGEFEANGGAIHVNYSQISIADSIFENNFAFNGGSVFALESSITIINCTFTSNQVNNCGGAIAAQQCNVTISNSSFEENSIQPKDTNLYQGCLWLNCDLSGGAVSFINCYTVEISDSEFLQNKGLTPQDYSTCFGGAVFSIYSTVTITNSVFSKNSVGYGGGAIGLLYSTFQINDSMLIENVADFGGGGIGLQYSTLQSYNSTFVNNTVQSDFIETGGGAIGAREDCDVTIDGGLFSGNSAPNVVGGAIAEAYSVSLVIKNTLFTGNEAHIGGAILVAYMYIDPIDIQNCSFINNTAQTGAIMAAYSSHITSSGRLNVQDNTADVGVMFLGSVTIFIRGTFIFINNNGSLFIYNSLITFQGESHITNNTNKNNSGSLDQGGGLTSFQSTVNFTDNSNTYIMYNEANNGGGILSTESALYNFGNTIIKSNRAKQSGGGMYAYQSTFHTRNRMYIAFNEAGNDGGGVYSVSTSTVYTKGHLDFYSNSAAGKGGAMYLESDSKLYINKEVAVCSNPQNFYHDCTSHSAVDNLMLNFTSNTADYGGALYVADNTTSGTCSARQSSVNAAECFYQVLASYNLDIIERFESLFLKNTYFASNSAKVSGDTLYGGLLDRCIVSSFAEVLVAQERQVINSIHGVTYFNETSNLNITEVSSSPVRVCFCNGTTPDCAYQPPPRRTYKGEMFEIAVVAVDQVNNTIPNTTIHGSVRLTATESLDEGQSVQRTTEGCTDLQYNVFSPNNNTQLYLYAEGPCKDRGISITSITIELKNCPIGFKNQNNRCECDSDLNQYITNCSIDSQSVVRVNNTVWISYINDTESQLLGYVKYSNCPFDYCMTATEQEITINLNEIDGSDAQCAFNRSGTLCGSCANGTSVTLGSSRCKDCKGENAYLSLFIIFALAGVLLVTFLLALNLTVAVGTINGLIFYANIVAANRAIFIRPFNSSNILHVFIAWINLDFGFETCLFNGMDDYIKTWLQLAFPLYIIFLVVLVIVVAEKSQRMTKLLRNRNPVATFATLILLSYTKGLRVVIAALSYATLEYPSTNGSQPSVDRIVWLIDGNVHYFEGKHIPLFTIAIIVLIVGVLYTLFIFSWQWILRCPNSKCLNWITNTRLKSFMDAYHAPYKSQHRYWTGFLLLARIVLYLIASANIVYDPGFIFLSIVITVSIILLFNSAPTGGGPYKNWPLNTLEMSFIFNLLIFAVTSYHIHVNEQEHNKEQKQKALSNASISIAFITYIIVLIYHTFVFVLVKFRKIQHFVEIIRGKIKNKARYVHFSKAQEQLKNPLTQTLLQPTSTRTNNSIRLQRRLDLIGDEPIVPEPFVHPTAEITAVTHTVIDGIPAD